MTEQRLSPKSIPVLRALLAAHPDPVLKKELNGHIIPRLEKNNPPIIRPCAIPDDMVVNGVWPSKDPAYCLTRYGLQVARAIPADTPDVPDAPIFVNIETGELIPVPDAASAQEKRFTHSTRHHRRNGNSGPPKVDPRPLPRPRSAPPQPTPTVHVEPQPVPSAGPVDEPAPCNDCPEREELALIYKILPNLRDHIRPLLDLKRKLED